MSVLLGDAQQLGDDLERQLGRDLGHEVALTALAHGVDDLGADPANGLREPVDHPRREALVDQPAHLGVTGRVHVQQEQAKGLHRLPRGLTE